MRRFLKDHLLFLREFRRTFQSTGAIAPSSRFLARAMTTPFAQRTKPARILEVGPGTGAVTRRIVQLLSPEDRLDLVELNPQFVADLRHKFDTHPEFRKGREITAIHECPLQEYQPQAPYDFIISGLPCNNFPASLVREVYEAYFRLLAPGGVLSYFEYMYVRPLRKMVSCRDERQRLSQLDTIIQPYLQRYHIHRDWVFVNLPPAWVQHLRRPAE